MKVSVIGMSFFIFKPDPLTVEALVTACEKFIHPGRLECYVPAATAT